MYFKYFQHPQNYHVIHVFELSKELNTIKESTVLKSGIKINIFLMTICNVRLWNFNQHIQYLFYNPYTERKILKEIKSV